MGLVRKNCAVGFGIFCLIQLVFMILRSLTAEYDYMVLKRLHHLANLEFFMSLGSLTIYCRISELLKKSFGTQIIKSGLILILLGWQSCFSTHFILQGDEPHWFSIFVMVSAALCVHLIAFFMGFSVIESIANRIYRIDVEVQKSIPNECPNDLYSLIRFVLISRRFHTLVGVVFALSLTLIGFYSTSIPPRVYHQDIRIRNLPKELEGFRIALLTDVHIGPTVGATRVQNVVNIVNSLNADVVAIAGDLVDGATEHLSGAVQPLKGLKSKHGTYFSTGNHEYYHGNPNRWLQHFKTINVTPLHNSHAKLPSHQDSSQYICFAGVDDVSSAFSGVPGHGMNVKQALLGCNARAPTVLLVHQPNGVSKILKEPEGNVVDLFLAGHTHGGQFYIAVPFAYLSNAFFLGLYELPTRAMVYVSAGVHFWGPPVKMYLRLHFRRFKSVLKYEYMMILGSIFLWNRIKAAYPSVVPAGSLSPHEQQQVQLRTTGSPVRTPVIVSTAAVIVGAHLSYFSYYVQGWAPFMLTWLVHICCGLWIHVVFFLIGFSVVNFLTRVSSHNILFFRSLFKRRYLSAILMDSSVQTTISILLTVTICSVSIIGGLQLRVNEQYLKLGGVGRSMKMVVLSDIHAGPTVSKWHVENAVALSNEQDPDVVVITGDLVDGTVADLSNTIGPLKNLKSKQGIFYVTGNHEYYYGKVNDWLDELKKMNIQPLRNANVMLSSKNGTKICLAGVDDILTLWLGFEGHKMDWAAAIKGCEGGAPIVLLAHNPLVAGRIDGKNKVDLILSGHVHGGQFYIASPILYYMMTYFRGLYQTPSGGKLFVTSGAYYWGIPMKRAFTNEILVMNLR